MNTAIKIEHLSKYYTILRNKGNMGLRERTFVELLNDAFGTGLLKRLRASAETGWRGKCRRSLSCPGRCFL